MEQLHSNQEIPDPREINPDLPPRLVDVLQRVTSSNPELRPRSAGEVMKGIHYVFGIPYTPIASEKDPGFLAMQKQDIDNLLWQGLTQWKATDGTFNLGLTRFAFIDLERGNINVDMFGNFLLSQALTYGYRDDEWWSAVSDPRERLAASSILLRNDNEVIAARIMEHLGNDMEIRSFSDGVPEAITNSLLEIGTKSTTENFKRQIFHGLRELTRSGEKWDDKTITLSLNHLQHLGHLALDDTESGDAAAELIGHLRSSSAVRVITDYHDNERKIAALLLIQQTAGNLPAHVKGSLRFRLRLEWAVQRLIQQPVRLISAYVLAFLGSALGIGIQNYLTINLTGLFNTERITLSLERGLIIGLVFGLGIFLSRVLTERFHTSKVLPRVLFGTVAGGIVINLALLVFHVLFLNTPPRGLLITAGSMLIAFAFVIGGMIHSYLFKVLLTSVAIVAAITGTWWLHVGYAVTNLDMTPIFVYQSGWTLIQVALFALGVALPIGILGNMINLVIDEELD